jgi:hypothetical protein
MMTNPYLSMALIMCVALLTVLRPCEAQSVVNLPQDVKAVWDIGKAHRETTATRERVCLRCQILRSCYNEWEV